MSAGEPEERMTVLARVNSDLPDRPTDQGDQMDGSRPRMVMEVWRMQSKYRLLANGELICPPVRS
jgi:hypothetical protein